MSIANDVLQKLVTDGEFIDPKKLQDVISYASSQKISLYEAILAKDLISDENLCQLIADSYKMPPVFLKKITISDAVLKIVPERLARNYQIVAFFGDDTNLKIATSNPDIDDLVNMLQKKVNKKIVLYYATPRDIENTMALYKKQLQTAFEEMLKSEVTKADKNKQDEAPIIKIVNTLIEYAYDNKASDIHIEPKKEESVIRFRIDSVLHDVLHLPKSLHDQIISRIKVMAKLRTDEHLSAQDGKMTDTVNNEDIDIRVSVVPLVHGEDCVMRLLTAKNRSFSLVDLGMSQHDLERVRNGYKKPYGMVLSTGPTGSGKTTTMYAVLKLLNTRERNIATIEDPVEYDIEGVSQIQVNEKTNLTFANGLRSILRQDPDIIFVGEIRDRETVGIAINSALTGHLVLSTLHTNDAASSLLRMIDMGVEPFLIASSTNTIIAQRLVRTICEKCKMSLTISAGELIENFPKELVNKYFKSVKKIRVYVGKGCEVCHMTGYLGRIGLFEVLVMSEKIKELVIKKSNSDEITALAKKEDMTTMLEDGLDKIQRGITSIEEVLRVTKQ